MINASLENAAAVTMSRDLHTICGNRVVDELVILWGELVQAFLDDVVSVQVLNQHNDVQTEGEND